MATLRLSPWTVWADEGTFLSMTASLVHDGDLRFDEADLARLEAAQAAGAEAARASLILQRIDGTVYYSKPVVYPLLAAPFQALAGDLGPIVLNLSALLAALALAGLYLRLLARRDGRRGGDAGLVLATFALASVLVPYALWRMADSLQASLALAGLVLVAAPLRLRPAARGRWERWLTAPGAALVGTALLALLVPMRINNAVLLVVPLAAPLLDGLLGGLRGDPRPGRRRRALGRSLQVGIVALATVGAASLASSALVESINPYRAPRTSFTPATGFPAGPEAAEAVERFDRFLARHHTELESPADARRVAYSALYFWVGRHTGLLLYFPAALVFLAAIAGSAVSRRGVRRAPPSDGAWDGVTLAALAAFAGTTLFLVGWKPENYYGGDTFLGNRYLLPAYPALLVALPRLPRPRLLAIAWVLAGLAYGSAIVSAVRLDAAGAEPTSQAHAYAGVYRLLPFESTAQPIAGVRDRYWAGHLVRFVDPYARVGRGTFDLRAGAPPAEISLAHWRPGRTVRLAVDPRFSPATTAPDQSLTGRLVVSDWRERRAIPLVDGRPTTLELELGPAWRSHRFWFEQRPFFVHAVRLHLELDDEVDGTVDGTVEGDPPAGARLVYLGAPGEVEAAMYAELRSIEVPPRVAPGTTTEVRLRVANTSDRVWDPGDSTAVTARWRLRQDGRLVAQSGRIDLPRRVGYGEEVEWTLPVEWPATPGGYRLEIDLVLEHVAWFGDRHGEPLWAGRVAVR